MMAEAAAWDGLRATLLQRLNREPTILFLDVDGTLAPIADRPADAAVPPETLRLLTELVTTGASVVLVSGRSAPDARRMVPVAGTWVIGNHGAELLAPDGTFSADERVVGWEPVIRQAAGEVSSMVDRWEGIFLEDKRWTLSIHYRLAPEADTVAAQGELRELAERLGLRVTLGKKVLELRSPVDLHKGTAVVALARTLAGPSLEGSFLYAGDDRTDEDAFVELRAAAPWSVTVRVGAAGADENPAATFAEFEVRGVAAMTDVLGAVLRLRGNPAG
jgi:trehalose-phosphatase